ISRLFEILCKSSPICLFKFVITYYTNFKLEPLKSFFNNWKNRHPMVLKIDNSWLDMQLQEQIYDMIQKFEAKGIIKKHEIKDLSTDFGDFNWMQEKSVSYFNMDKF